MFFEVDETDSPVGEVLPLNIFSSVEICGLNFYHVLSRRFRTAGRMKVSIINISVSFVRMKIKFNDYRAISQRFHDLAQLIFFV